VWYHPQVLWSHACHRIQVYFDDSLKFFLSLYGHKLPVLSLAISTDNTLLISGSADKNVKIWGLDFGDCHRSLFAHSEAVTALAFVPKTHLFFSAGRDKTIKARLLLYSVKRWCSSCVCDCVGVVNAAATVLGWGPV
jgi:WD40 repeat protein